MDAASPVKRRVLGALDPNAPSPKVCQDLKQQSTRNPLKVSAVAPLPRPAATRAPSTPAPVSTPRKRRSPTPTAASRPGDHGGRGSEQEREQEQEQEPASKRPRLDTSSAREEDAENRRPDPGAQVCIPRRPSTRSVFVVADANSPAAVPAAVIGLDEQEQAPLRLPRRLLRLRHLRRRHVPGYRPHRARHRRPGRPRPRLHGATAAHPSPARQEHRGAPAAAAASDARTGERGTCVGASRPSAFFLFFPVHHAQTAR